VEEVNVERKKNGRKRKEFEVKGKRKGRMLMMYEHIFMKFYLPSGVRW